MPPTAPKKAERKYTMVDVLFFGLPVTLVDLLAFLLILAGLDDFGLIDMVMIPATNVYYFVKGTWKWKHAAISGTEALPWVGTVFPAYSFGFWSEFAAERLTGKVGLVAKLITADKAAFRDMAQNPGAALEPLRDERPSSRSPLSQSPMANGGWQGASPEAGSPGAQGYNEEDPAGGSSAGEGGGGQGRKRMGGGSRSPYLEGPTEKELREEEELEERTGSAQAEMTKLRKGLSELPYNSETIDLSNKNAA